MSYIVEITRMRAEMLAHTGREPGTIRLSPLTCHAALSEFDGNALGIESPADLGRQDVQIMGMQVIWDRGLKLGEPYKFAKDQVVRNISTGEFYTVAKVELGMDRTTARTYTKTVYVFLNFMAGCMTEINVESIRPLTAREKGPR